MPGPSCDLRPEPVAADDSEPLLQDPDHHVIVARRKRLMGLTVAGVTGLAACGGNVTVVPSASQLGETGGAGGAAPSQGAGGFHVTTSTTGFRAGTGGAPVETSVPLADAGDADVIDLAYDASYVSCVFVCGIH